MIKIKFSPQYQLKEVEVIYVENYEAFFVFYMNYHEQGLIFGVEEIFGKVH